MNRKLRKLIIEEKRATERLSEAQEHLNKVREARVQEEEREMVRALRSMGLGTWDMFNLMTGIQEGNFSVEMRRMLEDAQAEEEDADTSDTEPGENLSNNTHPDNTLSQNNFATGRDEEELLNDASEIDQDVREETETVTEDI